MTSLFTQEKLQAYQGDRPYEYYDQLPETFSYSNESNPWVESVQIAPAVAVVNNAAPGTYEAPAALCLTEIENLDVDTLKTICDLPDNVVSANQARFNTIITFQQQDIVDARRGVKENANDIGSIESINNTQDDRISALELRLNNAKTRQAALTTIFATWDAKITALQGEDWDSLQERVAEAQLLAEQQTASIQAQYVAIERVETAIFENGLKSEIDDINLNGLNAVSSQISALSNGQVATSAQIITDLADSSIYSVSEIENQAIVEDFFQTSQVDLIYDVSPATNIVTWCAQPNQTIEVFLSNTSEVSDSFSDVNIIIIQDMTSSNDIVVVKTGSAINERARNMNLFYRKTVTAENKWRIQVKASGDDTAQSDAYNLMYGYKVYKTPNGTTNTEISSTVPTC